MKEENKNCENCNGTGEVEKNIHRGEEGMQIEMDVMVICNECGGKGYKDAEDLVNEKYAHIKDDFELLWEEKDNYKTFENWWIDFLKYQISLLK
ncbi:MAG: hypothetical protein V4538_14970 [Bacteroidota bacterium]